MPTFHVETEALTAASAVVVRANSDVGTSHAGLKSSSGALADTPAETAFAIFVGAADSALGSLDTATSGLARALNEAAIAYQLADQAAAASMPVKR
ncbi:MAG TPA: type VII secretion target [Solirubrobacteraceae bacterium]|nr:type VII secretion target [Solirubrobacteraceae bacterium]